MSYSDLLAQQDKELERLNQEYYADHASIKKLQSEHYDKTRFDGQLDRLRESFERKVKEVQARFAMEQKEYLNEPAALTLEPEKESQPDISQSQDRMAATLEQRRQQRAESENKIQELQQGKSQVSLATGKDMTDEVRRLMHQAQARRAQQKQPRRGYKR